MVPSNVPVIRVDISDSLVDEVLVGDASVSLEGIHMNADIAGGIVTDAADRLPVAIVHDVTKDPLGASYMLM